ncbi:MAG TPA: FAD-dependent thymidylate synthase, partial [Allocoleopsis sp.]
LDQGVAKEQARAVLPEGLTRSRMYMSGTLRSWIHYILLRAGPETQKEHREIAIKCREIILKRFPSLKDIFSEI